MLFFYRNRYPDFCIQAHSLLSNSSLVRRFFKSLILLIFLKDRTKKQGIADKGVCDAAPWTRCARLSVFLVFGPDTPWLWWPGFAWRSWPFTAFAWYSCTGTGLLHFAAEAEWELVLVINYPIISICGEPTISQISQLPVICPGSCLVVSLLWWQNVMWLPQG